jgi:hydrogenase nickel incorporation protein HypA/HybF
MHELAICQALMEQVVAIAVRKHATAVTDIHVGLGPLSGVEPGLMQNAFPIAAAGTLAGAATLHLRETSIRVKCAACGAESTASANRLVCAECQDWRTMLVSGDELLLERVELDTGAKETREEGNHV